MSLKIPLEIEKEIITMYKSGLSTCEIEKRVPYSSSTIKVVLRRNNICRRKRSDYHKIDSKNLDDILLLYDSGESCLSISKKIGCSNATVLNTIKRYRRVRKLTFYISGSKNPNFDKKYTREEIQKRIITRKENHQRKNDIIRLQELHPVQQISEAMWLRNILKENEYKCEVRNKKDTVACHHLFSVNKYPEKRWSRDNIVVISKDLHVEFHTKFMGGFAKPTTPDDWNKFLISKGLVTCQQRS